MDEGSLAELNIITDISMENYNDVAKGLQNADKEIYNAFLSELQNGNSIFFTADKYDKKTVDGIKNLYKAYAECCQKFSDGKYLNVAVKCKQGGFSKSELVNLQDLDGFLQQFNTSVFFKDLYDSYSISEALSAYGKLNKFVDKLKRQKDLSPLEKLAIIYSFTAYKVYKKNENNPGLSRDLISVLNSKEIVCVGYANIFKTLCEKVGIPCRMVLMGTATNNVAGRDHVNCRAYVTDTKYGVDGYYDFDPCFDSVSIKDKFLKESNKFSFFMLPLGDYPKNKAMEFTYKDGYDSMIEGAQMLDSYNVGGKIIKVKYNNSNNVSLGIVYREYAYIFSEIIKKRNYLENITTLLKTQAESIINNIKTYCPEVLTVPLQEKFITKAICLELLTMENNSNKSDESLTKLKEMKTEFYRLLNNYSNECKNAGIEQSKTNVARNTKYIKSSVAKLNGIKFSKLDGNLELVYLLGPVLYEQQVIDRTKEIRNKYSKPISSETMLSVIERALKFFPDRVSSVEDVALSSMQQYNNTIVGGKACWSNECREDIL